MDRTSPVPHDGQAPEEVDLNSDWSDPRAVPGAVLGGRKAGRKEGQRFSEVSQRPPGLVITCAVTQYWCECHPDNPAILSAGGKI